MLKHLIIILLACTFVQAHTVVLTWQLSEDNMPRYQSIWRQVGCTGAYVKRAQVSSTTVEWTDNYVKNGKKYCYYVTVTDIDKNTSGPSNTAEADIPNN